MKKLLIAVAAIGLIVSSCAEKKEKNTYTIAGNVPTSVVDGSKVYLKVLNDTWRERNLQIVDSTVVQNGSFSFSGTTKEKAALNFVSIPSLRKKATEVILEPGDIKITMDSISSIVEGTATNVSVQNFLTGQNEAYKKIVDLYKKEQEATNATAKAEVIKERDAKQKTFSKNLFEFAKANMSTDLGTFFFIEYSSQFDVAQLQELLALVSPEHKSNKTVTNIQNRVTALDNTKVGNSYLDMKGKDPQGKDIALSDYVGKSNYILIDFWASWCPPCRKDMPLLVSAYKKYRSKGLEIVGVSIDDDNSKWQQGITDLKITWPQISDLKGWDSALSKSYGVSSIPHTVIIDKEGKIIARGLHGEEVITKLDELFK